MGTTNRKRGKSPGIHGSFQIGTNETGKVPDRPLLTKQHRPWREGGRTLEGLLFAPWATTVVSRVLGDIKSLYLLSDVYMSSALTMNAGLTHPESAQGVGERTRCRDLAALASCSWAEAEVAGRKQRSVR